MSVRRSSRQVAKEIGFEDRRSSLFRIRQKEGLRTPEAVLRIRYPRFESRVQLFDDQAFSGMAHIGKPFSKKESGYGRTFHVRTALDGSIVVSRKWKAQRRRCERMRKPIPDWI
jgi:hypothetical protein